MKKVFKKEVVYLGCAIIGGHAYFIFASQLNINWNEFISATMQNDDSNVYLNDNMGYYHKVLYLEYIRNK